MPCRFLRARDFCCRGGSAVLQPSVQFLLTFSSLPASAIANPQGLQALVTDDLQVASSFDAT